MEDELPMIYNMHIHVLHHEAHHFSHAMSHWIDNNLNVPLTAAHI